MVATTWTQTAGMTSDTDTDNIEDYAAQAEASKDAAAASETAAAGSAAPRMPRPPHLQRPPLPPARQGRSATREISPSRGGR